MSCNFIQNPYQIKVNKEISQSHLLNYIKQNVIFIKRLFNFDETNYYINNRVTFVKDIFNLIKILRFKEQTAFKAVTYMDYILYNNQLNSDITIASIVLSSFIISAKFCEIDPKIPNLIKFCETFMQITNFKYAFSKSEINYYEMFCLQQLEYKLNVTTMYDSLNFLFNSDFFKNKFFIENNENTERAYYKSLKIIEDILLYDGELYISDHPYILVKYIVSYILEYYFNNEICKSFNKKFNDKEKLKESNQIKLLELLNKKFGRETDYIHLNNIDNYLDTIISIREDSTFNSTDNKNNDLSQNEVRNNNIVPRKKIFLDDEIYLKKNFIELNEIFVKNIRKKKINFDNLSVKNINKINLCNSFINSYPNMKLRKFQSSNFNNNKNNKKDMKIELYINKIQNNSIEKKKNINFDSFLNNVKIKNNLNRNIFLKPEKRKIKKYSTIDYNNNSRYLEKNNMNNFNFRRSFISHY